jgi:hypothetical protein
MLLVKFGAGGVKNEIEGSQRRQSAGRLLQEGKNLVQNFFLSGGSKILTMTTNNANNLIRGLVTRLKMMARKNLSVSQPGSVQVPQS